MFQRAKCRYQAWWLCRWLVSRPADNPVYKVAIPSFFITLEITENVEGLAPPTSLLTCILVLTRSRGWTKQVAAIPAEPPNKNFTGFGIVASPMAFLFFLTLSGLSKERLRLFFFPILESQEFIKTNIP